MDEQVCLFFSQDQLEDPAAEVNHEGEGASTSGALEDLERGRTRRLVHSTAMCRLQRRGMYD
jgi:hypothetical protein